MLHKHILGMLAAAILIASATLTSLGQTGELRGHVIIKQADGQSVPASDAVIDVFRIDVSGKYNTKTNKKGEFVFAGLPYVGDYIIAGSHPSARPTFVPNVKVGRDVDYEVALTPGDGKRLTLDEIETANKKISEANEVIGRTFKTGNEALVAASAALKANNRDEAIKKYTDAITAYDEGLAADAEQPALLTNK